MNILAGDVGGTQVRFAIVRVGPAGHEPVFSSSLQSRDFVEFDAALEWFLAQAGDAARELDAVSLAIAGPVETGVARVTNLDWRIEADTLASRLGTGSVLLMNDFVAAGEGLDMLPEASVVTLNEGLPERHAPRALIGAGTGLGQALLTWNGRGYDVYPTEGGHVDFAPRDDLEIGLLGEMRARFGRVSVERLVSGAGLTRIFDYLCSARGHESEVIPAGATTADRARLIGEAAVARRDPLCMEALRRFLSLYGAQAGNLALTCLPRGGLYVAGGIAAKVLPVLRNGEFLSAFLDKGRMRPLLERIPVKVVLDPAVGLRGAALVASRRLLAARVQTPTLPEAQQPC